MENKRNNEICDTNNTKEKQKAISTQWIPEWKLRMMRTFLGSRSNEKNKRDVQKIGRNIVEP